MASRVLNLSLETLHEELGGSQNLPKDVLGGTNSQGQHILYD